jgi:hypothetical protein
MKQRRKRSRKQAPPTSTPPLDWQMPLSQPTPIRATVHFSGSSGFSASAAILTVTRPEEIPTALAQGIAERRPVLIDIRAFQWRASVLATVQKWGGSFAWWLVKLLATFLLTQWLLAQGVSVPDWAKFNFLRQPNHKVILSPHEE